MVLAAASEVASLTADQVLLDQGEFAPNPATSHQGSGDSGDVEVTDTHIITDTEIIPRFAANPTNATVRSGNWSDPTIWSAGRLPIASDRVLIAHDMTVTYSQQSDLPIRAMEVSGRLVFSPQVNTRMTVGTMTVMPDGTLQIGTAAAPVVSSVRAELVIADRPLDLVNDPRQYGTGLLVLGTVTIHGATLSPTWTRLAAEAKAGDAVLTLSQDNANWKAGDTLVLPDSRQVPASQEYQFATGQFPPQWEEVTVHHVSGNRVYLNQPLAFDHLGVRNDAGELELLPHVASLGRNVVIRSQAPAGTRGHTMYIARADVDIRYARFQDLGRTDGSRALDNSKFDSAGNVTHIGTNQIGRYAVHFHHVMGPENPSNSGYQFEFVGNAVDNSRKWAIAVHDTSWGLVDRNVVFAAQGAGFVTEDGSEINNLFSNNIAIRIQGTHSDGKSGTPQNDYGRGGSGFWFNRAGNHIVGNVAADATYAGFVFDGYANPGNVTLPLFRGADKYEPGQGVSTALTPAATIANNEVYGLTRYGLWAAFTAGNNLAPNHPQTEFQNLRIWHIVGDGVEMYHTSNVTFRNLTILGSAAARDRNDTGANGVHLRSYENRNLMIRDSRIEGMWFGIVTPTSDASTAGVDRPTIVQNSTLKNRVNVLVTPPLDNRPGNGTSLELRNVKFDLIIDVPPYPADPATVKPAANIRMEISGADHALTQRSVVRVYDYNQVPGDNFQVFYHEQSPDYVLPQTVPAALTGTYTGTIGSPEAGLTNAENWSKYGISMGGSIAPAGAAASRPEVDGLVAPIINNSTITPRAVIVTPWYGAMVDGEAPLRIRYNVIGNLPAGSNVYWSLDNGPAFSSYADGGVYNVTPGWHTLRAWIGGFWGSFWPGTVADNVRFYVVNLSPAMQLSQPEAETPQPELLDALAFELSLTSASSSPTAGNSMGAVTSEPTSSVPRTDATVAASMPESRASLSAALRCDDSHEAADNDAVDDELLSELAADVLGASSGSQSQAQRASRGASSGSCSCASSGFPLS